MHPPARRRATWTAAALLGILALPFRASASSDRFSHSATLLPDGSVLFIGGQSLSGGPLSTIEIMSPSNDAISAPSGAHAALDIARSSHTATLLPNGKVLIAGGFDGTNIRGDAEIYDPVTQSIVTHGSLLSGMTPRMEHTATLLQNGRVLLCGGYTSLSPSTLSNTCDLFDPTQGAFGQFTANYVTMLSYRADHTATLLPDGRVFLAGGQGGLASTPGTYLPTTELYTYGSSPGSTTAGHPLIEARAYHQAVLMSNGRVLISGGFNGVNAQYSNGNLYLNYGYLDSAEVYDPNSDSIVPAAAMEERSAFDAALLRSDGQVALAGGVGNFTPQLLSAQQYALPTGSVSGSALTTSTDTVTTGNGTLTFSFQTNPQVSGIISSGTVYLQNPTIYLPGDAGEMILSGSDPIFTPNSGLQASLAGVSVTCSDQTTCGHINATLPMAGFSGTYYLKPFTTAVSGILSPGGGSAVAWSGGALSDINPGPLTLNAGASQIVTGAITIDFPTFLANATIQTGTLALTAGSIVQSSSFTVTVTGGSSSLAGLTIAADGSLTIAAPTFTNVSGNITWSGLSTSETFSSPQSVPVAGAVPPTVSFSGSAQVTYTASPLTLDGMDLQVAGATVVVAQMASSDMECYQPSNNSWSFGCATRNAGNPNFMETGTLRPNGDEVFYGGLSFSGSGARQMASAAGNLVDFLLTGNWTSGPSMNSPRGNFTATPLPNGKILLAGGANGPSSQVATADLFDPGANSIVATSSMSVPRDLHTATLLDNGRVLVAGGFSNGQATSSAEIYYPDAGVWLQTTSMQTARDSHAGILLPDGTVLVAGGFANGQYLKSAEIYISTSGTWQPAGNLNTARALATATMLPNGKVLIAGGVNSGGALNSAEIYDPATRTFTNSANHMISARYSHTATLLPHGDVLIAGGDAGLGELSSSERYHYLTDTFSAAASMNSARLNHTATLLPDGLVMVTGGATALGSTIRAVESYHESDDAWATDGSLGSNRGLQSAVVGQNGMVYVLGGYDGSNYLSSSESLYFEGNVDGGNSSVRQSSITSLSPSAFDRSVSVVVAGKNFLGQTEASGGGVGAGNSSQFQPRLELQSVDGSNGTSSQSNGGFIVDLSTYIYLNAANSGNWSGVNTSLTVQLPASPATLPYGWYHLREFNNAVYSNSLLVHAGPLLPANAATNLSGSPISTSAITWTWRIPAGTYDGFNVYSATSGVFITTISVQGAAGTVETWTEKGLAPDTTGQISVAPYNLSGDGPSLAGPIVYSQVAPPTGLTVSSVSASGIALSWSANGNTVGAVYEISMSTLNPPNDFTAGDLSVSTPVPTLLGLTTTTYIITNLQPSTTYDFRVRAFDGFGNASAFSNVVSTQTLAPISSVSGTRQGPTSIQWTWINPCSGQSVCSFSIYNATTSVLVASDVVSSVFLENNLGTNSANSIQVQAVTSAGAGPLTASATVYTDAAAPASVPLAITGLSTGSVTVSWAPNGNPRGTTYQVTLTPVGGGAPTFSTTTAFATSLGQLSPPAGVFDVKVVAVNGDDYASSADSPTAVLDYGNQELQAAAPSGLTATSLSPTSILLGWNTNNNSSSATYQVTYTTDNFVDVQTALAFSAHVSTGGWIIGNLLSGATYQFVVQAENLAAVQTAPSTALTVETSNGGAPPGELGGTVSGSVDTTISGTLGNGQSVSMYLPAGSFPDGTTVLISSYAIGAPPCANGTPLAFAIGTQPELEPLKPVTVSLAYTPSQLPTNAGQTALMRVDPVDGTCVPLQTTLDTKNLLVTAQLNHFSIYELASLAPATSVGSASIFPNPFYPERGNGYVTFDQLPAGAWLRIFTLRGELVYEDNANASGLLTWPGTNRVGRPVASGVYLVEIRLGGDHKIYKLAVER